MNFQLENPPAGNWRVETQQSGRATVMPNSTTLASTNTEDSTRRAWPVSQQHTEAIVWASWGLEIGALNGKAPYTRHGFKDFTTDQDTLNTWWGKWPTANIGARPPAYAVVLDVDVRSGGLESWREITGSAAYPTDTLVTITGTGGAHVWYRLPYTGALNGKAAPGIDVKHHSGYLVMPGSTHPATGELYRCTNWCDPAELPELPHTWRKHVYKPLRPARPVIPVNLRTTNPDGLVKFVEQLGDGDRNNGLFWAVCVALEDGLDIVDDLAAAGESIGLTATEVQATVRSAHNKVARRATAGLEVA